MLYGLSSLLVCARPLSYLYINNVFTSVLILLCHRQSILIYLTCIFLLECVLAKCILFCMWVLKNLHKWYCAENPIPFPAFVTRCCMFKVHPCCSVFIYSAESKHRGDSAWWTPTSAPPHFPRPDTAMVAASPPPSSQGCDWLCL